MLFLPLLTALLGSASAFQRPQPHQQPLGAADDDCASSALPTGPDPALTENPPTPTPPSVPGRGCHTLDDVFRGVDTVVEGAVHASASGLVALYVCRRRGNPDCELVGGLFASAAASLFLVLKRVGGSLWNGDGGAGFGWFSVDDVTFLASAGSLSYLLYLSIWSGLANRRTSAWLSITFFQGLALLYRGFRDDLAPGEANRLLLLSFVQTMFCVLAYGFSGMIMADVQIQEKTQGKE